MNHQLSDNAAKHRWYILGKGAIACLWASYLSESNKNVTLIERQPSSHNACKQMLVTQDLVYYDHIETQSQLPTKKIMSNVLLTNAELLKKENKKIARLIIATKSQDVITALTPLLPVLSSESNILLLCNGYGIHEQVNTLLAQQNKNIHFFAGVSSDGALLEKPFHLNHTGKGLTTIGRYSKATSKNDNTIKLGLVSNAILKTASSNCIQNHILEKFFINCAINPLTALLECRNGELLSRPDAKQQFESICKELQTIYEAVSKNAFSFNVYEKASKVALQTSNNISSMLKDRQAGRPLEIQFLTEKLIELAIEHHVNCTQNQQLLTRLKGHL